VEFLIRLTLAVFIKSNKWPEHIRICIIVVRMHQGETFHINQSYFSSDLSTLKVSTNRSKDSIKLAKFIGMNYCSWLSHIIERPCFHARDGLLHWNHKPEKDNQL